MTWPTQVETPVWNPTRERASHAIFIVAGVSSTGGLEQGLSGCCGRPLPGEAARPFPSQLHQAVPMVGVPLKAMCSNM